MGISQQIGASSIIKPGVVDNTAARPASPYEGQVIFQKDTDQLLVWNGTAWVIPNSPTQNPDGLELVKAQTVGTGVASVAVTDAFSANYDSYLIRYINGTQSVANDISLQLTGLTTGYYGSSHYDAYTAAASGVNRLSNVGQFTYVGGGDSTGALVNCTLYNPFAAKPTFMTYQSWSGSIYHIWGAGKQTSNTSVTGFSLIAVSGTLTGGSIRVYGYRN